MKTVEILGVRVCRYDRNTTQKKLSELLRHRHGVTVFTPNAEILWRAHGSYEYRSILNSATLLLPDGAGVVLASKIKGSAIPERITGIDTGEWLLEHAAKEGLSVFFLGGGHGVADAAAKKLKDKLPALSVCGTHHGYFNKDASSPESMQICRMIRECGADMLFVCLGSPDQEKWILENIASLPSVRLAIGLGGSLDVWSGKVSRAPALFRRSGLEWLFRAMRDPRRLARLRAIPRFLLAAIWESIS